MLWYVGKKLKKQEAYFSLFLLLQSNWRTRIHFLKVMNSDSKKLGSEHVVACMWSFFIKPFSTCVALYIFIYLFLFYYYYYYLILFCVVKKLSRRSYCRMRNDLFRRIWNTTPHEGSCQDNISWMEKFYDQFE